MNHCPAAPSAVLETRRDSTTIWRRRRCSLCGETFVTCERLAGGATIPRAVFYEARPPKKRGRPPEAVKKVRSANREDEISRDDKRLAAQQVSATANLAQALSARWK